ncbi:MAG: hypothetical protein MUC50_10255 [Myxococcota bacterium]|jgi:hypothetical protein|nr:hypothetical protein [Myxococcota bacterium]
MRHVLIAALCLCLSTAGITARAEEPVATPTTQGRQKIDSTLPMGPILLGSFGAVAVLVGAGFAWQAKGEYDSYNERNPRAAHGDVLYPNATQSLANDFKTHVIVADVLMFGGAVAVGASLIWGLVGRKKSGAMKVETKTASVAPSIAPNRLGLVVEF